MIGSKVDSQFLGTIQTSFKGVDFPVEVKIFIAVAVLGACLTALFYLFKHNKIYAEIRKFLLHPIRNSICFFPRFFPQEKAEKESGRIKEKKQTKHSNVVSSDRDVIELLINRKMKIDVSAERNGQRSLAGVVVIKDSKGLLLNCRLDQLVSKRMMQPGGTVKCIFLEMRYGERRVNAFVGKIVSLDSELGVSIERTSGFGFVRRRVHARRKVADQRYIKVKVWKIDPASYDIDSCLDNIEPDILVDNRRVSEIKSTTDLVLDVSKGGIAIKAGVRLGGQIFSVNDSVLLVLLMYSPKRKIFTPHLILGEVRGVRNVGNRQFRLSFQFLQGLKVPPRRRSTLFPGQVLMASDIENMGN